MSDRHLTAAAGGKPGWLRRSSAIPLALGGVCVLQTVDYLLLQALPPGWYPIVTSLTRAAVILLAIHLYRQWRSAARAGAQACARMQELKRIRSETTQLLGHDLKNQLTVIGGALSVLSADPRLVAGLGQPQREILHSAASAQHRLISLLDQTLDLSLDDPSAAP